MSVQLLCKVIAIVLFVVAFAAGTRFNLVALGLALWLFAETV